MMTQLTQMQSRQSITDKSSAGVEASDPETSQLRRKSVAFSDSHNIDEDSNDESSLEGGLPSRSWAPTNGQSSSPSPTFQDQSSYKGLHSNGSATSPQYTLGRSIRNEIFYPTDKSLQPFPFLPRDKLEGILTKQRIIEALKTEGGFPPERQGPIAQDIISPQIVHPETQPHLQSRKEILAILCLIDKVPTIESFIKDGLFDYDLPFRYLQERDSPNGYVAKTCDLSREARDIPLFYQWSPTEIESFDGRQWIIHVPLFTGLPEKNEKPTHYEFAEKAVAPYISRTEVGRGGFSAVDKVEVHARHVIPFNHPGRKTVFAIKRLVTSNKCEFDAEVSNLNRFAGKDAPHLIQLLWTFSLGQTYHLVFPYADGNLQDLWREHKSPLAAEKDYPTALWFSRQCLGIVEGLHMIQHSSSDHDSQEPQKHGQHGDLKPENILWFRDSRTSETGYSLGTLKISDFGLTRFHGTQSKSHINTDSMGCSPTYRAPEYDVLQEVAQSYDIWCLGCVLLEFTTWYLKGWAGVDSFSEERKGPKGKKIEKWNHEYREDTFFNRIQKANTISAQAKKAVRDEVQSLYKHEDTSDLIIELIEFLETSLLRLHPDLRKRCPEVLVQFQRFFDTCLRDQYYCLEKKKTPPIRRETDNSDLSHLEATVDLHSSNVSLRRVSLTSIDRPTQSRFSNPILEESPSDLDRLVRQDESGSQPQKPHRSMTDPDRNSRRQSLPVLNDNRQSLPVIPSPVEDPKITEDPVGSDPMVTPDESSQEPEQPASLSPREIDEPEPGQVAPSKGQPKVERVPIRDGANLPGQYDRLKRTLRKFILCEKSNGARS